MSATVTSSTEPIWIRLEVTHLLVLLDPATRTVAIHLPTGTPVVLPYPDAAEFRQWLSDVLPSGGAA